MTEQEFLEIEKHLNENGWWEEYICTNNGKAIFVNSVIDYLKQFVKPKPEFKVGDSVSIYHTIHEYGTIHKIQDDTIYVMSDYGDPDWYFKKQCRRLKKKER